MNSTYLVCSLIVIVLLSMYVKSYYKYPETIKILQTSFSQLTFDMFLHKQLLVIDDKNSNLDIVKEAWFRFSINSYFDLGGSDVWHKNRYKYALIQAKQDGEIMFFPAKNKNIGEDGAPAPDENIIAINASKGQIIVVPLHWLYMIPPEMVVQCIGVHDVVSYLLP